LPRTSSATVVPMGLTALRLRVLVLRGISF
jgi:hypothetical protein